MLKKGKVIIFSAPSGSGKTTIVHSVLSKFPDLEFSVSAATRAPRKNEVNGKDYFFLSVEEFKEKIKQSAFLEWEDARHFDHVLVSDISEQEIREEENMLIPFLNDTE